MRLVVESARGSPAGFPNHITSSSACLGNAEHELHGNCKNWHSLTALPAVVCQEVTEARVSPRVLRYSGRLHVDIGSVAATRLAKTKKNEGRPYERGRHKFSIHLESNKLLNDTLSEIFSRTQGDQRNPRPIRVCNMSLSINRGFNNPIRAMVGA